jgi:hypothetical protein
MAGTDTMNLATVACEHADTGAPASSIDRGPVLFTHHARKRGARRNVAPDAAAYVVAHGRALHRTGVMFYFLGRRDIPRCDRSANWAARMEGTIVIVATGGVVITVYRDRRGFRAIARKLKYRLYGRDRRREEAPACLELAALLPESATA